MIKLAIDLITFIIFFIMFICTDDLAFLIMSLYFAQEFRAELNVLRIEEKIELSVFRIGEEIDEHF